MKHLPKHIRPRWRYLAVGIESAPDAEIDRGAFQRALWYAAGNLLGDAGSADADLTVFGFEYADGVGEAIVRTRRGETDAARAALACIDSVDDDPIGLVVRGISGTVRACEESYLRGRSPDSVEETVAFADDQRPAIRRDDIVEISMPEGFVAATELDLH
ncbi:ribonuclease P [Halonotius terrestris]|uniref:Ribonuclease P protein component 2 n=1 Tax=Halonotius terrestris TaxID=2487750 RepID=A0A8J8TC79_9EURY|nr:Rpp14/Pop5 family protein [Halonotius terrestris]TQQ79912.1 ribonuclease P [Halonotius terrestris]